MNVVVSFPQAIHNERPVDCYARSFMRELRAKGHNAIGVGEGHEFATLEEVKSLDCQLLIEIDNGRNTKGELPFQKPKSNFNIPSAVFFIDSHGHSDLHESIAKYYDHIFFAVWNKRDLFKGHKSAHWLPNCTDKFWFNKEDHTNVPLQFDFGFHGSKNGLYRADPLKEVCVSLGLTFDIRQITKPHRHKWPHFAEAMMACGYLFNKSQKHDGPNQRVMESMILNKPLLSDNDPMSGMSKLFEDGVHYVGYEYGYGNIREKVLWMLNNPEKCVEIARAGYQEVLNKHLIGNRVDSILEVVK